MLDPEVLLLAANDNRVLVTRDVRTMRRHFVEFIQSHDSPGVIQIPSTLSISQTIEDLVLIWATWNAEELRNQMRWSSDVYRVF